MVGAGPVYRSVRHEKEDQTWSLIVATNDQRRATNGDGYSPFIHRLNVVGSVVSMAERSLWSCGGSDSWFVYRQLLPIVRNCYCNRSGDACIVFEQGDVGSQRLTTCAAFERSKQEWRDFRAPDVRGFA